MYPMNGLPGVIDGGGWNDLQNLGLGGYGNVEDFRKAVSAGYGTDVATLTGGGALRLQSIEATLLMTLQENRHFVLFNALEKTNATATVDEYTVKERIGGYPGSAFNSEAGDIAEDAGDYQRKVGLVKYLMTKRSVTAVQRSQRTLVDTMADQAVDGTLELLTSTEWGLIYGDSDCSSLEFDGIVKQLQDRYDDGDLDRVLDLRGQSISPNAKEFIDSASFIAGYGNFGMLTDFFCSNALQADLDQKLDPAFRVNVDQNGPSSIQIGAPVRGIRTSWGNIKANADVFIQEGQPPFKARGEAFLANVSAGAVTAPTSIVGVAAGASGSLWEKSHEGNYYWAVEGVGKLGHSDLVKSDQVAVVTGDGVTLTITHGATNATSFVIYRGRRNGTNDDSDFREMVRVPRSGAATTVYVDKNQNIPGTSVIPLLTMSSGRKAITLRRLLPLTRFALYPTSQAVYPFALLLFCYLRLGKIRQHRLIKNVLPSSAAWRPFNV